ncbi:MAG: hypothetical protein IH621_09105 [Krumholzibacteria bacterium]|nr:hypothetical protein [Candidatus Krumholzibacteria bacterium]
MLTIRSLRTGTGLMALGAIMLLLALGAGGCSDDASPTAAPTAQAPNLPDPAALSFDFPFFDQAVGLEKSGNDLHANFVNAYLRVVVLQAVAELTLATPVAAFAVALHTVPVAQPDGAWVWSYTWTGYRYPIRVALRGLPAGDHVQWEMRVSPANTEPNLLWFEGTTSGDGSTGRWLLHDLDDPAQPVCGEIAWGQGTGGRFLEFTSREPESAGDMLRFSDANPDFAVTFVPGTGGAEWFIRWHADGTGSLKVPDYNGGLEACWDRWQENVDCE